MKYLSYLLIFTLSLSYFKSKGQITTFIRPSVALTTIENNSSLISSMNKLLNNNNSYYVNRFNDIIVKNAIHSTSTANTPIFREYKKRDKDLLKNELNNNYRNISVDYKELSKEMISYLFNFHNNLFSYDRMLEMAKISASDLQMFTSLNSKDKTKIFYDISEAMLNKVYILTIDVRRIGTMDEYYDRLRAEPQNRLSYGYTCEVDFYLTKLIWTKENADYFFENCWIDDNTSEIEKETKIKNFQNLNVKSELLLTNRVIEFAIVSKLGAKHKTMSELFDLLPDSIYYAIVKQLSEYSSDFKLSSVLTSAYPCAAKIGTKEGISLSERYYAFEKIEKTNGEYEFKRKGVLRVKMVGDNKDNNLSSQLQQQGGRKLYPGMSIIEKKSNNLNIVLSTNQQLSKEVLNLNQYNINFNFGPYGVKRNKKSKNRYIGLNIGFGNFSNVKFYKTDANYYSVSAFSTGLEFNRELYFTRKGNLFLYPSLAINGTIIGLSANNADPNIDPDPSTDENPFFINTNIGLGLGLHLGPRFSLIYKPFLNYNLLLDTDYWDTILGFENRFLKNFNNSFALRIQF